MVNRFVVSVILVPDGPRKINVRSDSHADPATRASGQLEVKESCMDHAAPLMKLPVSEPISGITRVAATAR